jgi:peptidoglycan/LPS O-acetylase OafA/YrhL
MHAPQVPVKATADYRPDIDGLRAVAVLSVLAYHYGASLLAGGFTGVDVFFVISGFLITSKLTDDLAAGTFSILKFYDRRVRRILPALVVMLAATLLAGRFLLMPGDYKEFANSAATAAFGISNFYFFGNTGYFDQAADLMPLLHTWSLAVEEQFYVVWPVLLLIINATRKRVDAAGITAALTIAVFGASLVYFSIDPKGAFYMAPPRAWELTVGALLVFLPPLPRLLGSVAKVVGLAIIGYGFVCVSAEHFPYVAAIYPCVGAALVIWPSERGGTPERWLGTLAPIGLISYSLYLWHWPIWVYFRIYINGGQPRIREVVALGAVSILAATFSYLFVERPFRKPRLSPSQNIASGLAASVALLCAAMFVHSDDGMPGRIPSSAYAMRSLETMWKWPCDGYIRFPWMTYDSCRFGASWTSASHKALLWGDSHAEHMAPILEAAAGGKIAFTIYHDCPASLGEHVFRTWPGYPGTQSYEAHCTSLRDNAISYLKQNPDITLVVFAASWTSVTLKIGQDGFYPRSTSAYELLSIELESLIEKIDAPNRRFLIVADIPQFHHDPVPCALVDFIPLWRRSCGPTDSQIETSDFISYQGPMYEALQSVARGRHNVDIILPGTEMCKERYCLSMLDGEYLYKDGSHIRRNLSATTKFDFASLIGLTDILHNIDRTESSAVPASGR